MASTYSFINVVATIAGPTGIVPLGYGSSNADEGISIDMIGDRNTMLIGADGNGMHSLHADKSGTVTVRLLQVSATNALLQAMYDAQQLTATLWGQNTITIQQMLSGDITACRQCAFKKKPALSYKKDGIVIDWIWDAIKIDTILGVY